MYAAGHVTFVHCVVNSIIHCSLILSHLLSDRVVIWLIILLEIVILTSFLCFAGYEWTLPRVRGSTGLTI